ncbi:carboxypeptidase regulatory-like domain-containing protein, partial [Allobranchiibius sp. CTAmp26]|nr:carboxypeptidase regulatory-like domain-containing protein [Allobranchiibius sp. CTAmp26]
VAYGTLVPVTPKVSGSVKVGYTLTATPGAWGPAPVSLTYQWYRVSSAGAVTPISGAKASTYKATASDRGYRLKVAVTGSESGYTTADRESALTSAVAYGTLVPVTPKVSGSVKVGYTLTATPGAWGPAPVSLTYQWYRVSSAGAATPISGAKASTYKATASDRGYRMKVRVTGTETGYTTAYRESTLTSSVPR